jgi:hypothetical protein
MRATFKVKWDNLSDEDKIPFNKKARDHVAKQEIMQECITDALKKSNGGNCSRSFQSIAKVSKKLLLHFSTHGSLILTYLAGNGRLVQQEHDCAMVKSQT